MSVGEAKARRRHLLYFSLEPDGDVSRDIATLSLALIAQYGDIGKRVARHRLHLSLHGIAELDAIPSDLRRLAIRVGDSIVARPFELWLDRVLTFGGNHVVLVPTRPPAQLQRLHRAVNRALADAGLAFKLRFQPHVTLFRDGIHVPTLDLPEPIRWVVDELSLVFTIPSGKRTILRFWPLRPL